jgi:hypothetical protein
LREAVENITQEYNQALGRILQADACNVFLEGKMREMEGCMDEVSLS